MEIYNEKLTVLKFEFIENEFKNSDGLITTTFNKFKFYPNNEKNNSIFDYGVIFNTLVINKNKNKKVLVYDSEWKAKMIIDSYITDVIYIAEYLKNGVLAHEKYFNKHKSSELNIKSIFHKKNIKNFLRI